MGPNETPSNERGENVSRKPYTKPLLSHLGSVRDLTFGASGSTKDGVGAFKKTKDGF